MPKVPEGPSQLGVMGAGAGVDVPNFAYDSGTARAVEHLGAIGAEFGSYLMQTRKKAEDQDFVFSTTARRQRELTVFKEQLQNTIPNDYKGYSQQIQDWVNDRFREDQEAAPSQAAKQMYISTAGAVFNHEITAATGLEFKQKAISFGDNIKTDSSRYSTLMMQTPLAGTARSWVQEMRERVDLAHQSGIISAKTAQLLKEHAGDTIGKGLLEGLYARGLTQTKEGKLALQEGLDLLMGSGGFVHTDKSQQAIQQAKGMLEPGNIDIDTRPRLANRAKDQLTTLDTMVMSDANGRHVLVPAVDQDGKVLTPQQAIDAYKQTGKNYGAFNSITAAKQYARAMDNEKRQAKDASDMTGREKVLDYLSPHDRAGYVDKFLRALQTREKYDLSLLHNRQADNVAAAAEGKPSDPKIVNDTWEAARDGHITAEEALKYVDTLIGAQATGDLKKAFATTDPRSWDSMEQAWNTARTRAIEQIKKDNPDQDLSVTDSPVWNERTNQAWQRERQHVGKQILAERAHDIAAYAHKYAPGLLDQFATTQDYRNKNVGGATQNYIRSLLGFYSQIGIDPADQKLLTKSEMATLASTDQLNSKNPKTVYDTFNLLQKKYQGYMPNVFTELVDNNKIDPKLWVASYMKSMDTRQRTIENIVGAKGINEAFQNQFDKATTSELDAQIVSQTRGQWAAEVAQSGMAGNFDRANAFREVVALEAKKQMLGKGVSSPSAKDAVERAISILEDRQVVQDANSVFTHPQSFDDTVIRSDILAAFARGHIHGNGLVKLNISIPAGTTEAEFLNNIKLYGRWVDTPDKQGLELQLQLPKDPRPRPVKILDKDGNEIRARFSFRDIMLNYQDEFTNAELEKSGVRKYFEDAFPRVFK